MIVQRDVDTFDRELEERGIRAFQHVDIEHVVGGRAVFRSDRHGNLIQARCEIEFTNHVDCGCSIGRGCSYRDIGGSIWNHDDIA